MTSPDIVLVAGGCGPGFSPRRFGDRWGRWRVRCAPNRYYYNRNYNRNYNRYYYNRYY